MLINGKTRGLLIGKLSELFQLDLPNVENGFSRLLHAKAGSVQDFIDKELCPFVKDQLKKDDFHFSLTSHIGICPSGRRAETSQIRTQNFELASLDDHYAGECTIYEYLYRFFQNYYCKGLFSHPSISTGLKNENQLMIPIEASSDSPLNNCFFSELFYIGSVDFWGNCSFELKEFQEREFTKLPASGRKSYPIHFRVVDVCSGDHNNMQKTGNSKRIMTLTSGDPITVNPRGELVINFESSASSSGFSCSLEEAKQIKKKYGAKNKGDCSILRMTDIIFIALEKYPELTLYRELLQIPAPTKKIKYRPLLTKYIEIFLSQKTMDFFIHKDLKGFLHRELDLFITNNLINIEHLANADRTAVISYWSLAKILRKTTHKIIDILGQFEILQKKLWLKKKFVLETNYCITLDRIPEESYREIAANESQHEEWVSLFAIDEIASGTPYSKPLTVDFLKENRNLVLDTRFFDETFKAQVLSSFDDFDEELDGLLVHSDNFQALHVLENRFTEQIRCTYIDPPYNTGEDTFPYKDNLKHFAWAAMMSDRLLLSRKFLTMGGVNFISIGTQEIDLCKMIAKMVFGDENYIGTVTRVQKKASDKGKFFAPSFDFIVTSARDVRKAPRFYGEVNNTLYTKTERCSPMKGEKYRDDVALFQSSLNTRPNQRYYIECPDGTFVIPPGKSMPEKWIDGAKAIPEALDGVWRWSAERYLKSKSLLVFKKTATSPLIDQTGRKAKYNVYTKSYLKIRQVSGTAPRDIWFDFINRKGADKIKTMGISYPYSKPPEMIEYMVKIIQAEAKDIIMDFFAGSGTTAHAVIDFNRKNSGHLKYILVEKGDHFDTILKPRILKAIYSEKWKKGKPLQRNSGISHCVKYIRLESYQDTLNNLRFEKVDGVDDTGKMTFMCNKLHQLNYLLDWTAIADKPILDMKAFNDPTSCSMKVKTSSSHDVEIKKIDIIETFNFLIGLRVVHGETISDLPGTTTDDNSSQCWFRIVEGWVPKKLTNPNDGSPLNVLVIWRKVTGCPQNDTFMLNEWFQRYRNEKQRQGNFCFDKIYVNCANDLEALREENESWEVYRIEEEFINRMWENER